MAKAIKESYTKSQMLSYLAEEADVDLKAVKAVYAALEDMALRSLLPRGVGEFSLPGILKISTRKVPARKAGTLVRNPSTGEMVKGKAKPASIRVKIRPLTKVKAAANGEYE